ncbi:Fructosamine/Ketosamine-3-kinase [Parasitella parasitica]|nr:Fructosamine/Ketosamine-3-kinase [Parasitella parasitica]
MSDIEQFIRSELERLGLCTTVKNTQILGGGCISQAALYATDKGDYFVKTNSEPKAKDWFTAESLALELINQAVPGFAPKPIHHHAKDRAYIVTEYVAMTNSSTSKAEKELGRLLAKLHAAGPSPPEERKFGFDVTSWCGTTILDNTWSLDWLQFYKSQRLEPLLRQVKGRNNDVDRLGASLCARLEHWLGKDALGIVSPSLLHGDLWNGNMATRVSDKSPLIYDPASFYGHYETEFGIMKMFGGFTQDCFDAYDDALVNNTALELVDEGRQDRAIIYESYHHLNHYAMFGGSYSSGFIDLMERLL